MPFPVWDGLSSYLREKLQKLQNRAARVILQANCEVNSSLLLETLKWNQLSLRRRKHKAIMMFKSLNGLAPVYLHELFSERHTDYDLRDSFRKLNLPKPRTNYGILFLKVLGRLDQLGSLRRKSTAHFKHSIPTRQSCKSVF